MRVTFKDIQVGDVFGFCAGDNNYAFARLIYYIDGACYLVEVFDHKASSLEFDPTILMRPRLMPIQNIDPKEMLRPRWGWKVVSRDKEFVSPLDEIRTVELLGNWQVKSYDVDWTPDCGRMRVLLRRVSSEAELLELKKKLGVWDWCWNPDMLICDIRKRWNLEPYEWPNRRAMWEWFCEHGVYFGELEP